jgi:hypothetical protein
MIALSTDEVKSDTAPGFHPSCPGEIFPALALDNSVPLRYNTAKSKALTGKSTTDQRQSEQGMVEALCGGCGNEHP